MKNFGSYDLPGHIGESNIQVLPKLPEGIKYDCKIHGLLKENDTYGRKYKDNIHYTCKFCMLSKNIKRKYDGMDSLSDYDSMLLKQNGVCACCFGENNTARNGIIKRFNIDHDHATNKVRGLLCSFCNALLGYAKDNIEILQSAITYLKNSK